MNKKAQKGNFLKKYAVETDNLFKLWRRYTENITESHNFMRT